MRLILSAERSTGDGDGVRQRDSAQSTGSTAPNEPDEKATYVQRYRYGATELKTVAASKTL
jgi:hypothetical protein